MENEDAELEQRVTELEQKIADRVNARNARAATITPQDTRPTLNRKQIEQGKFDLNLLQKGGYRLVDEQPAAEPDKLAGSMLSYPA